jgi:menaquinone-dependent protoporphyrinogen oxidase
VPIGSSPDPAAYDAVVVGSAVHGQAWLPQAVDWLRTSRDALASRPVWAFSVGMPAAVGRPFRRLALREGPKIATALSELTQLEEHRLFSGVVAEDTFRGSSRWVFRLMGLQVRRLP